MIQEDYVSFETAKLLEEKGFDEYCPKSYFKMDKTLTESGYSEWERVNEIKAPTQSLVMKWLREVHNLHIMVNCIGKVNYDPIVQRFDGKDFEIEGVEVGTTRRINGKWENVRRGFKTYEEAVEAAIKYCLENLIKP